jgi:hypothetical protein
MFCPRCAAQNLDDAKFCRVCGTNLETVALALTDKGQVATSDSGVTKNPLENWLETRKAAEKIVRGIGLFLSSLLIGVALWLFSGEQDWIIIWTVLAGWLACFGVISMVSGIAGLLESRFLRRQLRQSSDAAVPPVQPFAANDRLMMNEATTAPILGTQSSVTEHTTTRLIKP